MAFRQFMGVILGLTMAAPAWAQPQGPNALVLRNLIHWWGSGCAAAGGATETDLQLQGIPYTTVNPATFATVDLFDYTMIFLADCQDNATYNAWNARKADLDTWVDSGGFLGVHATRNCNGATVQPDIPGGTPSQLAVGVGQGNVLVPGHPILAGLGAIATGSSLAHDEYPNTGNASDTKLITSTTSGNAVLFERIIGHGTIIYGGLTYACYALTCGSCGAGDSGTVLKNEVTYGATFDLCGTTDADGDGVGDDCDACPGFNDKLDGDQDEVPDACDPCPGLPEPSDIDHDGICDNVDDSDDDGVVDIYDVCPGFDDTLDTDADGIPDDCDNCPLNPVTDQYDGDGDGYGLPCDCDDNDPTVNPDADEYCNGIDDDCDGYTDDYTSIDAQTFWVDADGDGHGDVYSPSVDACEAPVGHVTRAGDCNDADVAINPDAPEKCDDIDQNCDGNPIIEGCPVDPVRSGGCNHAPTGLGGLVLAMASLLAVGRRRME